MRRAFTTKGRRYAAGDRVNAGLMPASKFAQLAEQRVVTLCMPRRMIVTRVFTFDGTTFRPGDEFPVEQVSHDKRKQLLEQRFIQPQAVSA